MLLGDVNTTSVCFAPRTNDQVSFLTNRVFLRIRQYLILKGTVAIPTGGHVTVTISEKLGHFYSHCNSIADTLIKFH